MLEMDVININHCLQFTGEEAEAVSHEVTQAVWIQSILLAPKPYCLSRDITPFI